MHPTDTGGRLSDGWPDGAREGIAEGSPVGCLDGWPDGEPEGIAEGSPVGIGVGAFVGAFVGAGVGAGVPVPVVLGRRVDTSAKLGFLSVVGLGSFGLLVSVLDTNSNSLEAVSKPREVDEFSVNIRQWNLGVHTFTQT